MYRKCSSFITLGFVNGMTDIDIYSFDLAEPQFITARLTSTNNAQFTLQLVNLFLSVPSTIPTNVYFLYIHTLELLQGSCTIIVTGNLTLDYELEVSNCSVDPSSCAWNETLDVIACECVFCNCTGSVSDIITYLL